MLSYLDWLGPRAITRENKEELRNMAVKLNVTGGMVAEAHSLGGDSAWGKIKVDFLQRALIDHGGSSVMSIFKAPREA